MRKIRTALADVSVWMDQSWVKHGSAAMLAFFIAFAFVFVLTVR